MLFDLCYLAVLCAIIILTFTKVLLPLPVLQTLLEQQTQLQNTHMLHHLTIDAPSSKMVLIFCVAGLLYLKVIWRLINPPKRF